MAQVVIFAPPGEDVEAGQAALKKAGHEVEVVEATAANLLHMAIGMLDGAAEQEPVDTPEPVQEPAEEPEQPEEPDPLAAEEPKTESLGTVYVDGEAVKAYLDRASTAPVIRALGLAGDAKLTYRINESEFSFWRNAGAMSTLRAGEASVMCKVAVQRAKSHPHVILDEGTARQLRLV